MRQQAKEPFGDAVETQPDIARYVTERLPRREGFHETAQRQIGSKVRRGVVIDSVVDESVTERFPSTQASNDARTEHGSDLLNNFRMKQWIALILVQQILEAHDSVEQAHESDLEGGVFIFFSDYRYNDTSCVDLR
jgi:hypothetical protein